MVSGRVCVNAMALGSSVIGSTGRETQVMNCRWYIQEDLFPALGRLEFIRFEWA